MYSTIDVLICGTRYGVWLGVNFYFPHFSVITVRRRRCTTVVGTHLIVASNVNRRTGTRNIKGCAAVNDRES